MVRKNESNQAVVEQPKYIVVNITWRDNLLLELKEGMEYLRIRAGGIRIKGDLRSEPENRDTRLEIGTNDEDVTISYMTETKLKQLIFEALSDPEEEES